MRSPLAVRLFLATERCEVLLAPGREVALRRSEDAQHISLLDPSIPRDLDGTAKFKLEGGKVWLVPGAKAKPILVNGRKIKEAEAVEPGDRIRIGYTVLVVQSISELEEAAAEVRTLSLNTMYWQQRAPLLSEADRLAQWSEGFDRMMTAGDEESAGQIILEQLLRLVRGQRGLLTWGWPPRELGASGLEAVQVERLLRWLGTITPRDQAITPAISEVLETNAAGRAVAALLERDDETWGFYLEPGPDTAHVEAANRAMAALYNFVVLFHTLHRQQKQQRLVNELTQTARVFARRSIQGHLDVIQSRFVFRSEAMRSVCTLLARAAAAPSPVLLLGEPGTGKQLAADALHAAGDRAHRDMVSVNLVEIPEALIESQLFGHVARAFTGARDTTGLLARAHLSTLFLDEIGEAPLSIQAKLLRVLEYGVFQKIGAPKPTRVDIRLITATNRDLEREVREGRFRQDLYDRINVIPVELPPLRERSDDIPVLADSFLDEFNKRMGKRVRLSSDALRQLEAHSWPDNVRGLRNYLERIVALADVGPSELAARDLPALGVRRSEAGSEMRMAQLDQELRRMGRHNQARILRTFAQEAERRTKRTWSEQIGMSQPVFRRELQALIAFSVKNGLAMEFYEQRVALREEDLKQIDRLGSLEGEQS